MLVIIYVSLIKPEYPLSTENKHSIYFDHWIKLLSKGCNAQLSIYLTFSMKMKIGIYPVTHTSLICVQI